MRRTLTKRILAMFMCLMMVLAIMPDTATASKKVDTGSGLSTSTWNTISILGNIIEVPQCDQTSWKVENANFIVASKTNSEKDKGFIVWTVNELNERAMADIINAIGQKSTWADFKKLDDNKLPVTFVYGDTSKLEGLIKNAVIKPVENDIQIDFSAEKVWTKYMYGSYIYIPEPTTIVLTANKLLKNESDEAMTLNGGEFTFVLKGGAEDVYTTNDANGDISFTIYFDEPGNYDYTIMEVNGQQPGYSYDSNEFEYTVEVVDNEGQLVAQVIESPNEAVFTNTYTKPAITPVDAEITATKVLTGKTLDDGQFTFLLYSGETADVNNFLGSTTNTGNGDISFTRTFAAEGVYYFTVAEADDNKTGYTYDNKTFTYEVTVTKDDTTVVDNVEIIKLGASVKLVEPQNAEKAVFTNSYKPLPTTATIFAGKELRDADGNLMDLAAGQFKFHLLDEDGNVLETVGNAVDRGITFSAITYDKVGTYNYTVNEVIPEVKVKGYTYDESVFEYEVVVVDKGGQLEATVNAPEDITFNNNYKPLSTTEKITATKELRDADSNLMELAADQFKFHLLDEDGKVIETVGNAIDGSIVFSAITYDKVGTYKYTVNEVKPEVEVEGYTYDESVFEYTVEVVDNEGQLEATVALPEDTTFNNSYELEDIPNDPPPLSAGGITAIKVLEGKELTKNQFQFQLRGEDGKLIETVYNAADGKIIFSPIEYKMAGTYIYKVNEIDAGEDGYTYDKSVFEYRVVVEEIDGYLVAKVNAPGDITFNNSYELEDIPDDPPPLTGDSSNSSIYIMLALAALCTAAFVTIKKRKAGTNNR